MVKRHIFIFALFAVLLIALSLTPLYASEPFAPIAECNDGRCSMSEADYKAYREWHFALLDRLRAVNEQNAQLAQEVDALQARLVRNAYCEGHRS